MSGTTTKRDLYWDSLKLFLIFLVIYAHLLASFAPDGSINRCIYSIIYFFHMPLFVFITGRFSYVKDRNSYIHGLCSIFGTFLLFHVIWRIIPEMMEYWEGHISVLTMIKRFLSPGYTLWYLLSMFFWRLIVLIVTMNTLNKHVKLVIIVSFTLGLLSGFVPLNTEFSFQRTVSFLPFFILGYYSHSDRIDAKKLIRKVSSIVAFLVFGAFSTILLLRYNHNWNHITYCDVSYYYSSYESSMLMFIYRFLFFIIAMVLGFMFMRLVLEIRCKHFSNWGRKTLFIYIWHSFLVKLITFFIENNFIPNNSFLTFLYSLTILFFLIRLSNNKVLNTIQSPTRWSFR